MQRTMKLYHIGGIYNCPCPLNHWERHPLTGGVETPGLSGWPARPGSPGTVFAEQFEEGAGYATGMRGVSRHLQREGSARRGVAWRAITRPWRP